MLSCQSLSLSPVEQGCFLACQSCQQRHLLPLTRVRSTPACRMWPGLDSCLLSGTHSSRADVCPGTHVCSAGARFHRPAPVQGAPAHFTPPVLCGNLHKVRNSSFVRPRPLCLMLSCPIPGGRGLTVPAFPWQREK